MIADLQNIIQIKNRLGREFKMKDLGKIKDVLGMRVDRQGNLGNITIMQERYIQNMLQRFRMGDCKPISTPLEANINVAAIEKLSEREETEIIDATYRELVGCLTYLSNASRAYIAFAASFLSHFCNTLKMIYWKMAKRVLQYLRVTIDYGIKYTT